jgi:hypothetical protein
MLFEFKRKSQVKDALYWKHIKVLLQLMKVFLFLDGNSVDINQRVVADELFDQQLFEIIFFPIRVQADKIQIFSSDFNKFINVELLNDKVICEIVD